MIGRPEKKISQKQFEELCKIQCTKEEILSVLCVCEETLDKWCKNTYGTTFSGAFKEKREGGKMSLRRMQWNLAEKNATMGIWLGKQYLNQKDQIQQELKSENRITIVDDLPDDTNENICSEEKEADDTD